MKRLLKLIGVVAFALTTVFNFNAWAGSTEAQQTFTVSLPNVLAATSSNLPNPVLISVSAQQNLACEITPYYVVTNPATQWSSNANVVITMYPTVDLVRPDTNGKAITWTTLVYGTNSATCPVCSTNLNPSGYPGYYITTINNQSQTGTVAVPFIGYNKIGFP